MNIAFWVLMFVLIFSSGQGLAVPIESLPEPEIRGADQIALASAAGSPLANIPDGPVHMYIKPGTDSRFELFFIDAKYGYDVVDFEDYKAWCLQKNKSLRRNAMHKIRIYNCYDPDLPPHLRAIEWNQINYIINHKKGSKEAIQQAIWHFTPSGKSASLSAEAAPLVREANLNGKDYRPAEGELIAVVCLPEEKKQAVFIEFKIPEATIFDVASATFVPPVAPALASSNFFIPPVIPFFPHSGHNPPDGPQPPDEPHSTPEPSSFLLLASGIVGVGILLTIGRSTKRT